MKKFIAVIGIILASFAASSSDAATIPAGTTLTVRTASSISSRDPAGRTFTARLDQDVVVNGTTLLRAGTNVSGRIQSSRSSTSRHRSAPLSLQLTSISANGRSVAIRTNSVQPEAPATTAAQRQHGFTAGETVVTPRTQMQFQLAQAVSL
jgi:hypothetical protein